MRPRAALPADLHVQFPDYPHYLYEVSSSDPTSINGTWFLGNRDHFCVPERPRRPSRLAWSSDAEDRHQYYQTSGSRQSFHHHWSELLLRHRMGSQTLAYGHYGMNEENGQIAYSCRYNCQARRIHHVDQGAPPCPHTCASTSVILRATTTLGTSVDEPTGSAVAWVPTGTSATYQISNDGRIRGFRDPDLVTFGKWGISCVGERISTALGRVTHPRFRRS